MSEKVEIEVEVQVNVFRRYLNWFDNHPRSGWYVGSVVTLHLLLDAVGLV